MKRLILFLLLATVNSAFATHKALEKDYQAAWCAAHGGVLEYRLPDATRVDCLTEEYAVEVEFSKKWAESAGQALFYGLMTEKLPAVALILEDESDEKYLVRLVQVAKKVGIKIFVIKNY